MICSLLCMLVDLVRFGLDIIAGITSDSKYLVIF